MSDPTRWTTPADIVAALLRHWERGRILAAAVPRAGAVQSLDDEAASTLFPLPVRLSRPDSRDLTERFEAVRNWIRLLEEGSKEKRKVGYEITWEEINHRQLGRNRVPLAVVVTSEADALALIGKRQQAERFARLVARSVALFPVLAGWLAKRPFAALEQADDWERVLAVLAWFRDHPRPGIYLRQLEIPGVDSKFIEARKSLFAELLDRVLPAESIAYDASGARAFELRYGVCPKPPLVRFRLLDPCLHLGPLSDLTTPVAQFARLELAVEHVFITENEINGLAFPELPASLVVFGLGYGLERLAEIGWLRETALHYWGDIDTHGFAILNRLRAGLPHARSLLMDRETLLTHRALWSREDAPHRAALDRLTPVEAALYDELREQRLGVGVRLEQERIAFGWLRQALNALGG
jgi:hypothetical protein